MKPEPKRTVAFDFKATAVKSKRRLPVPLGDEVTNIKGITTKTCPHCGAVSQSGGSGGLVTFRVNGIGPELQCKLSTLLSNTVEPYEE